MTQVSSVFVRALLEVSERHDVMRDTLLLGSGVSMLDLEDADARIELHKFRALCLRAMDLTGDDALGLHIAERASEAAFDLLGHVISHAPTLRDAVSLARQFQRLFMEGVRTTFSEQAGTASMRIEFERTEPRFDAALSEFMLSGLQRMLDTFSGIHVATEAIYFEHRRPAYHHEHARIFGGKARFEQPFTGIDFPAHLLDRPHLHRHSSLLAVLRTHAERALDRLSTPATLSARLEHYFLARAPSRIPDMETAARELGLSIRTLRRKLTEEGVSYRGLVQKALEDAAKRLLRDPETSLQQVAHELGFSDATSFHRAFKRWTGATPQELRVGQPIDSESTPAIDPESRSTCSRGS